MPNPGSEKDDGKFYRMSKNLFLLFVLHDPLMHKLIVSMQDQVIEDLEAEDTTTNNPLLLDSTEMTN